MQLNFSLLSVLSCDDHQFESSVFIRVCIFQLAEKKIAAARTQKQLNDALVALEV